MTTSEFLRLESGAYVALGSGLIFDIASGPDGGHTITLTHVLGCRPRALKRGFKTLPSARAYLDAALGPLTCKMFEDGANLKKGAGEAAKTSPPMQYDNNEQ